MTPADEEPFDIVARGESAWKRRRSREAEQLLERGVAEYRRREPDGVAFALGRYGAFLLDQGREGDAERVLAEAVASGTDIGQVWGDYLDVVARHRDADAVLSVLDRMSRSVSGPDIIEEGLTLARRAARQGDPEFAEQLASALYDKATTESNRDGRWAAIGDLGQALEKLGRTEEAVALWREGFAEGSDDPVTATRLTMALERRTDYSGAIEVIRAALARQLPATAEEQLRKRMARCEAKLVAKPRAAVRRDVDAFSVRSGEGNFRLAFQSRVRPPIRSLELIGDIARCVATIKDTTAVIDLDASTGVEVRRTLDLPRMDAFQSVPQGWAIGLKRTARVSKGPTNLFFVSPETQVIGTATVPDATSTVAAGAGVWYVGCRDGGLYAFDFEGAALWRWEVPGARAPAVDPTFRPCPYYVAASAAYAAVSSMSTLFAIGPDGSQRWTFELPDESLHRVAPSSNTPGITLTIAATGLRPLLGSIAVTYRGVLAGSSDGRLYLLDEAGCISSSRALGKDTVRPCLHSDGSLAAAWCDGALHFFDGDTVVNAVEVSDYPAGLLCLDDDIVHWSSNGLGVIDQSGRSVWAVEFSKRLTAVVAHKDRLVCAAGVLANFERT